MLTHASDTLQIITATLLGLVCILLAMHSKSGQHVLIGVAFTFSIFCYVVIEARFIQSSIVLVYLFMIGATCTPILFWLLAKSIFEDNFKLSLNWVTWFALQIIPHLAVCLPLSQSWVISFSKVTAGFVSFGFVLAALFTALTTKQGDLVDARM